MSAKAGSFVPKVFAMVLAVSLTGAAAGYRGVTVSLRGTAAWSPSVEGRVALWVFSSAALSGLVTAALTVLVAKRRLRALTRTLERVASADLKADLPEPPASEFDDVRVSFRRMRDAIDHTLSTAAAEEERRKRRLAKLAHELSSPVTTILGLADALGEPPTRESDPGRAAMWASLNTEIDRVTALVHDLRALAKAPGANPAPTEPTGGSTGAAASDARAARQE